MSKARLVQPEDLKIRVEVVSQKLGILEVPVVGIWGYASDHLGFLGIQVQRKVDEKYVDLRSVAHLSYFPGVDVDTLRFNERKSWDFSVARLYEYSKGQYRIRVLVNLSALNPIKDRYSNWLYFECEQKLQ